MKTEQSTADQVFARAAQRAVLLGYYLRQRDRIIREAAAAGIPVAEIAAKMPVSPRQIQRIIAAPHRIESAAAAALDQLRDQV
jgi:hypothetical protein